MKTNVTLVAHERERGQPEHHTKVCLRTANAVLVRMVLGVLAWGIVVGVPDAAHADGTCYEALDALGVRYERVQRRGIALAVRVRSNVGGVRYVGYRKRPLVLDCSLVYALARSGPQLTAAGIAAATYSSAYQVRNVRGKNKRSKHSFGLAIDIHVFTTADDTQLSVAHDYEQGLGDLWDCIGAPLTERGRTLRQIVCQLHRSGLYRLVLDPDYDAGHWNHLHVEASPWRERQRPKTSW